MLRKRCIFLSVRQHFRLSCADASVVVVALAVALVAFHRRAFQQLHFISLHGSARALCPLTLRMVRARRSVLQNVVCVFRIQI